MYINEWQASWFIGVCYSRQPASFISNQGISLLAWSIWWRAAGKIVCGVNLSDVDFNLSCAMHYSPLHMLLHALAHSLMFLIGPSLFQADLDFCTTYRSGADRSCVCPAKCQCIQIQLLYSCWPGHNLASLTSLSTSFKYHQRIFMFKTENLIALTYFYFAFIVFSHLVVFSEIHVI